MNKLTFWPVLLVVVTQRKTKQSSCLCVIAANNIST